MATKTIEKFVKPVVTSGPNESLASIASLMERRNVGAVVIVEGSRPVDDGIFDTTQTLRDEGVRRLPVVDDDGLLVGLVTLDDLLRVLSRELSNLAEGIRSEMEVA
jgi:CBS domain-containing protein